MPSHTDDAAPVPDVIAVEQMSGDDEEDTTLLREMLEQAKNYVHSFSWCDSIISSYFAGGVGKVFAIFLFKINSSHRDVDPYLSRADLHQMVLHRPVECTALTGQVVSPAD